MKVALRGVYTNFLQTMQDHGQELAPLYASFVAHWVATAGQGGGYRHATNASDPARLARYAFTGNAPAASTAGIVIVGGGPNGLYAALLLKTLNPELPVTVIENRVDPESKKRKLQRTQSVVIQGTVNLPNPAAEALLDIAGSFATGPETDITEYLVNMGSSSPRIHLAHVIGDTERTPVNIIEYRLARQAREKGVRIVHDPAADDPVHVIATYTGPDTVALFDATGSRLYRDMTGIAVTRTLTRGPNRIDIYEGALPPTAAVKEFGPLLYVAIGDTTLRTDFTEGKGLMLNWTLILFYALTVSRLK